MELIALLLFIGIFNWSVNKMDKKPSNSKNIGESNESENPSLPLDIKDENLAVRIAGYFQKNNIRYWLSEDQKSFRIGFDLDNEGCFDMFINIHDYHLAFACEVMNEIEDEAVAKTLEITSRINQFYNFGQLNFFFESRLLFFKIVFPLYQNDLNESKFRMYFDAAMDGARNCRPVIKKVVIEGEEPAIAVMSI
jgi:hypothetical protein